MRKTFIFLIFFLLITNISGAFAQIGSDAVYTVFGGCGPARKLTVNIPEIGKADTDKESTAYETDPGFPDNTQISYTNDGLTLSVPEEFADRFFVRTPENSEYGTLFSVSEKESVEAANAVGYGWEGAGWLFEIRRVSEEKMHELRCDDIPGYDIFAKDTDRNYYVYIRPTDVRVVREDYNDEASMQRWIEMNALCPGIRDTFTAENEGLTAVKFSYTSLDAALARIMYRGDVKYTLSSPEYGPQQPNGINAADFIEPLTHDVIYSAVRDEETPDGEYLSLDFAGIDLRFDFFLAEGKENYIRQVWFSGEHEMLYKAEFADENIMASEVMNDFYRNIVLSNSPD